MRSSGSDGGVDEFLEDRKYFPHPRHNLIRPLMKTSINDVCEESSALATDTYCVAASALGPIQSEFENLFICVH